jgi:hypothetical protein
MSSMAYPPHEKEGAALHGTNTTAAFSCRPRTGACRARASPL